ncbi:MAG TPA: hypothetical protein VGF56_04995 [Rhizomicrobium sp.]|jgi:hypothetical protein
MSIKGTSGDDNLVGTSGNDAFDLTQGGNDTAQGLAGNDSFSFGATFTAADAVDGGDGADVLKLAGDYSAGVTFGAATLINVETVSLADGFSYKLTTNDATVATGQSMTVDGSALTGANTLTFDGSAETDGTLAVHGGLGNDSFTSSTLHSPRPASPAPWNSTATTPPASPSARPRSAASATWRWTRAIPTS